MQFTVPFTGGTVQYLMQSAFDEIKKLVPADKAVFITDEHIAGSYPELLQGKKVIVIPPGEAHKHLQTIEYIIKELIKLEAQRGSLIIGLGGGVVTDIAGFAASVYMRGIAFGFVPTTLLGMVDAAIGGKNGVDAGLYKNVAGNFNQPAFILYDTSFLSTLPQDEWRNGFAEVIKYACVFDKELFEELSANDIAYYQKSNTALQALIRRCVDQKNKTVLADEYEKGERKLLNFGHTLGHAIENMHRLPHGHAVAIGMVAACYISVQVNGLDSKVPGQIEQLLQRYELPTSYELDIEKVMEILMSDKKRIGNNIDYIVLDSVGKASIKSLSPGEIKQGLSSIQHAGSR